jgi:hypothetical protein
MQTKIFFGYLSKRVVRLINRREKPLAGTEPALHFVYGEN